LNRVYINPSNTEHPTINAAKKYIEYLNRTYQGLYSYLDLHAHSSKRGAFLIGNNLPSDKQIENLLYAKVLEMNSEFVDYKICNFSEKGMSARDAKSIYTKEGCGRVAMYRSINIVLCYTVEICHHCLRALHPIS